MNLRAVGFWTLDALLGSRVRAELRDVELLNSGDTRSSQYRLTLLEKHLEYVGSRIPYYRGLTCGTSLRDFPVITKEMIRSDPSAFIASDVDVSKIHVASTSGSTGTPFRVFQDPKKRNRANAESIYFGELAGYKIGMPLWYLRLWNLRNSSPKLTYLARNIHPVDVISFQQSDARALLNGLLRRRTKSALIGYSSSLEIIARMLRNGCNTVDTAKIAAVIGVSEPFSQEARELISRFLSVVPVGRYALEELGILAQQTSIEDTYHLNLASHIVEVLRIDSDERAPAGETGRVVVTDFVNKAQPLVRYDTGDLAVVGSVEKGTGYVNSLSRLEGRSRDQLYDVNDQPIAHMVGYNFWWMFPGLLEYQIVQRERARYLLRLNVDDTFSEESELVEELRKHVGRSAVIDVEYSASDYQRASGKRRAIVSEYTPVGSATSQGSIEDGI